MLGVMESIYISLYSSFLRRSKREWNCNRRHVLGVVWIAKGSLLAVTGCMLARCLNTSPNLSVEKYRVYNSSLLRLKNYIHTYIQTVLSLCCELYFEIFQGFYLFVFHSINYKSTPDSVTSRIERDTRSTSPLTGTFDLAFDPSIDRYMR